MKKLTDTFGEQFEYLGAFFETDARITQNPAFQKYASSFNGLDFYDSSEQIGSEQIFYRYGRPILVVSHDSITMNSLGETSSEYWMQMRKFHIDSQRHLHAQTLFCAGELGETTGFVVTNSIYDEHGVELQRDFFIDDIPKSLMKYLSIVRFYYVSPLIAVRKFFKEFKFDCALGKMPVYKKPKKPIYMGLRRDMKDIEIVHVVNSSGFSMKERLDLTEGLTFMRRSGKRAAIASKKDLAEAIALEENEETCNALIGYCGSKGVTQETIAGICLGKK